MRFHHGLGSALHQPIISVEIARGTGGGLSSADLKAPAFYVQLSISSRCLLSLSIPLFWRKHMYLPIVNRVEVDDVVCFTVLSLSLHDIVRRLPPLMNKDLIFISFGAILHGSRCPPGFFACKNCLGLYLVCSFPKAQRRQI